MSQRRPPHFGSQKHSPLPPSHSPCGPQPSLITRGVVVVVGLELMAAACWLDTLLLTFFDFFMRAVVVPLLAVLLLRAPRMGKQSRALHALPLHPKSH